MKTVFNNAMVAHVWAQQKQEYGKSANGQFYFEGKTIYSYGRHFPVATFLDENTILFNDQHYSPTTARHQNYVRQAVSGWIIKAPSVRVMEMHSQLKGSIEQEAGAQIIIESEHKTIAEKFVKEAAKRKKPDLFLRDINTAVFWINQCKSLFEIYGHNLSGGMQEFLDTLQSDAQSLAGKYKVEIASENKIRLERGKARKKERAEYIKIKVEKWRSFECNSLDYETKNAVPIMLRINKDKGVIETSKGAEFPIEDAKRAFSMIRIIREKGGEYARLGCDDKKGAHRLGEFIIDRIDGGGNVNARCHFVEWPEIESAARALGIYP